ncbi:threonyl-tRNA aminoacylation [Aureococcus anophagefferens]|nr:threonyl-tRNA aminoacylation [Aureococcus anophagefferens]
MAPPALQKTGKFSVFDRPGVKQTQRTSGARLTTASAGKIDQAAGEKIGGPFAVEPAPAFTAHREAVWDRRPRRAAAAKRPIEITLPDGTVKPGVAHETSPLDIALGISKQLAGRVCVARVTYAEELAGTAFAINQFADEGSGDEADDEAGDVVKPVLWDLPRPLEGDCRLELLDFESPEGKMVFWHSAAHLLGAALEQKYGAKLSIGPPVEGGFYYDAYIGNETISDKEFKDIQARAWRRSGPIIDLCMGPQVPDAGRVKAFEVLRASSAYWLGKTENDTLQRVYGKLFFFDQLSPGSAFFEPHGARIYNGLIAFIKDQYWLREYTEVVTPNVYNFDLWHTSGHALHYKDDMFCFDVEGAEFGMKPMNCPGHCLMFKHDVRSWRDLPMRYADFGVLHRNELSGALSGLTRVRRFQQDDGHIFCREDQVEEEVRGALEFMKHVYDVFGMGYRLELSTRPKKALGDKAVWDRAEAALASAMDAFAGKGGWRVNPGDGAFYGPKIDIKVTDALERVHQCATIQLDFQLPIRFDLKYRVGDTAGDEAGSVTRPIIIHRAMLGSVERMMAVLTEHWGGKWPFWISPRQVCVIPVGPTNFDYARAVRKTIRAARFFVDVDDSGNTLPKKVRNAQLAQYNFILVVGDNEVSDGTVTVRTRANTVEGTVPLADFVARCRVLQDTQAKDPPPPEQPAKGAAPAKGNKK